MYFISDSPAARGHLCGCRSRSCRRGQPARQRATGLLDPLRGESLRQCERRRTPKYIQGLPRLYPAPNAYEKWQFRGLCRILRPEECQPGYALPAGIPIGVS